MGGKKGGRRKKGRELLSSDILSLFFWVTFFTHILILLECLLCATLQLATLCAKVTRTLNFLFKKLKPTFHSAGSRHSDRDSDLSGYIKELFLESPIPWGLLELCLLSRPLSWTLYSHVSCHQRSDPADSDWIHIFLWERGREEWRGWWWGLQYKELFLVLLGMLFTSKL